MTDTIDPPLNPSLDQSLPQPVIANGHQQNTTEDTPIANNTLDLKEVSLEHAVAVEAPTSDLRDDPEPVTNPAAIESKQEESTQLTSERSQAPSPKPQEEAEVHAPSITELVQSDAAPVSAPIAPATDSTPAKEEEKDVKVNIEDVPMTNGDAETKAGDTTQEATPTEANDVSEAAPVETNGKHERSEESVEPQAKRARTDDGSSPAVTFAEPDPQRKMTPNRQKYCLVVIRQLKKMKDANPFLVPVDPIRLKIPDYPKIVTNPQDLGTIEAKLKKDEYETIDDFIDCVQLVWANCERYNGAETPINKMALRVKEQFERQIRSMPAPEFNASPQDKKAKAKKMGASKAKASPLPVIRRESTGGDGRPKREIHAPPPKSLPYQNAAPRRSKNAQQLKFCQTVLKELMKKQHEAFAYPFYVPVDAKALGLTDYHTVIRNPMDLSTIQQKLNASEYDSADDFEYDIRLMLRNCFKYNAAGSPVNSMGKRLENLFNETWAKKPVPRPEGYGSYSDDESDDGTNKQTVQMLTKQLEDMKNQIAGLNSKAPKKKKKREYEDDGAGPGGPSLKVKKFGKKRDNLDDIDESPMLPTFEQKTALSTKMGYMTEHQMPVVIQILKRTDPNFDPEDEEVELDVDKVHPKTIRLLWNWIMEDTMPSFMRKKNQTKKKNRSVLSENEQQRQIEALEAQLSRFNGADPYAFDDSRHGATIPNDDSTDSESSEDDE